MDYRRLYLLAGVLPLIALLSLAGCYTQVGTVRSEREPDYSYSEDEQAYGAEEDSTEALTQQEAENYAYDDEYWNSRPRLGFMYYYPSFYFGATFYDPWYWDSWYWPRGAYYSYYDPFICGTIYPWYYAGWYHSSYGYYDPWYYGGHYRYRDYGGGYGSTRTFGNTRGSGAVRAVGSTRAGEPAYGTPAQSGELPKAVRTAGSSPRGSATSGTQGVSRGKRSDDQSARGGSRTGTVTRGGKTRSGASRDATRVAPPRVKTPPRATTPPRDSGGRGRSGGTRSSDVPSYSPPASAPSSSPAPSSGGGRSSSGGGSRGGNRR